MLWFLSCDKCIYCKSLWTKAPSINALNVSCDGLRVGPALSSVGCVFPLFQEVDGRSFCFLNGQIDIPEI